MNAISNIHAGRLPCKLPAKGVMDQPFQATAADERGWKRGIYRIKVRHPHAVT
jgi:hypothetical protein